MKKKVTALIFACLIMASAACGCGSSTSLDSDDATTVATTEVETEAPTTEEPTTEEPTTEEPTTEEPTTEEPTTEEPTTEEPTTEEPTTEELTAEEVTEAAQTSEIIITSQPQTVNAGEVVSLSISAAPNTEYSISVYYKSKSTAKGLENQTTDSSGNTTWEWKVGAKTSNCTASVKISGGGSSTSTTFEVVS